MRKEAVIQITDDAEYPFYVQHWIQVDEGIYQYYGNGRFCKTLKEAKQEKKRIERERR
jgi:hypothetical protein